MDQQRVVIGTGNAVLEGVLTIPREVAGVAIVISGLGSEARNQRLVEELVAARVAALRIGLLSTEEQTFDSRTGHFRYDADFLAHRLIDVAGWVAQRPDFASLPIAYVGSTIGAAAALVAAALRPDVVTAVVAINGRTDLAADYLRNVRVPTLFVLNDMPVLRMNRDALAQIRSEKRIEVIHADDNAALALFVQKAVHWVAEHVGALQTA